MSRFFSIILLVLCVQGNLKAQDAGYFHNLGKNYLIDGDYASAESMLYNAYQLDTANITYIKDLSLCYYFEKELTQYIDLQIFNTYVNQTSYESVKHNRKEKLTINEDFLNKLIQPTTIEEDLLYLSNDLIGVHLTIRSLKKEIKSAPVVSTPHITLYKTASNYWKAELDTNNRKISKFYFILILYSKIYLFSCWPS